MSSEQLPQFRNLTLAEMRAVEMAAHRARARAPEPRSEGCFAGSPSAQVVPHDCTRIAEPVPGEGFGRFHPQCGGRNRDQSALTNERRNTNAAVPSVFSTGALSMKMRHVVAVTSAALIS